MQKSIIPKAKSLTATNNRKIKKQIKETLETKSQLEAKLQKVINAIVREIDKGCVCISNRKPIPKRQEQGGHFISRGSHPALRFHLDNIFFAIGSRQHVQVRQPNGIFKRFKRRIRFGLL